MKVDYLVVGAGFTGATLGKSLASVLLLVWVGRLP